MRNYKIHTSVLYIFMLSLITAVSACSKEENFTNLMRTKEFVGCWTNEISETETDYWQFTSQIEKAPTTSRTVSITTPNGTYIITRVTRNSANGQEVRKLLEYGAFRVDSLRHEILMHNNLSSYDINFKVTIIDNKMTLKSDPDSPITLINVHRKDAATTDFVPTTFIGKTISFDGYTFLLGDKTIQFSQYHTYHGIGDNLQVDVSSDYIESPWTCSSTENKNEILMTVQTREFFNLSEDTGYGFDPVVFTLNLKFLDNSYGIISTGQVARWGKHWNSESHTYIEEDIEDISGKVFQIY